MVAVPDYGSRNILQSVAEGSRLLHRSPPAETQLVTDNSFVVAPAKLG
jgi:hypothetical protein